ncbi:hypothetical protein JOQ06_007200 [Pogonophryne albipinna]|uniref:Kelch domain-containing protein 8B n=1 Tax=Pogonophryne albipinna TaxID=1090488 RepID=A0AAD6FGJ1_9TELE|nr:hypothetical protein JOQ06_007200 [Pogonophryne albipinna]
MVLYTENIYTHMLTPFQTNVAPLRKMQDVSPDGKVYALGGMGADTTPQALVRVYEAEKDQWQPMTSMPTPRYGATPFVRGNKIYMMGRKQFLI